MEGGFIPKKTIKTYTKFKVRAECSVDIDKLINSMSDSKVVLISRNIKKPFPDEVLEFESDYSLLELQKICLEIPDGHVMRQTIAIASEFTGKIR
jgi:hypothetical protein